MFDYGPVNGGVKLHSKSQTLGELGRINNYETSGTVFVNS